MKRVIALAVACLLICGCARKQVVIHTFMPGETPPLAVALERGTRISTPDGKKYVLGCDGVVLSEGHWLWVIAALEYLTTRQESPNEWKKGL